MCINICVHFFKSGSGCSLKRYCTNKQFQNKQFKKTNIIKTEKKGYGICAVEDIPKYVISMHIFNLILLLNICICYIYILKIWTNCKLLQNN